MMKKKHFFFCTDIHPLHYARDLLTKMLEDDPNKRISSEEVVNELKSIKIEVLLFFNLVK